MCGRWGGKGGKAEDDEGGEIIIRDLDLGESSSKFSKHFVVK